MGYMDKKAMQRDSVSDMTHPVADTRGDLSGVAKPESNQVQFKSGGPQAVSVASSHEVGNQLRIGPNTKGTGRRGVPTAVAVGGKDSTKPAVENPSK